MEATPYFKHRIKRSQQHADRLQKLSDRLVVGRTIAFLLTLGLLVWRANEGDAFGAYEALVLGGGCFVFLVAYHKKVIEKLAHKLALVAINKRELDLLDHNFEGLDGGEEWLSDDHPYTNDLDIFGQNSLFQLLNRTQTPHGRQALAHLLQNPYQSIADRRKWEVFVANLAKEPDLLQNLAATGWNLPKSAGSKNIDQFAVLCAWQLSPAQIKYPKLWIAFALLLSGLSLVSLFLFLKFFDGYFFAIFIGSVLINRLFLLRVRTLAKDILSIGQETISILSTYHKFFPLIDIAHMRGELFGHHVYKSPKTKFNIYDSVNARNQIKRLAGIFSWLVLRGEPGVSVARNQLYGIFNSLFLLDVILVSLAEQWKRQCQTPISEWFDQIGRLETATSLAAFAYANPTYSFPYYTNENLNLHFKDLGHPLLPNHSRVTNDCAFSEKDRMWVITGSNMAGKSTFLRTLGINMVLGQIGAPVCASEAKLYITNIFTSMRTQDNLSEGVSAFYAELKRLESLLVKLKSGEPVFFFLDELLKGTNSKDRYRGAAALLKYCKDHEAIGMISTHDLAIGELAEKEGFPNYSFNSRLKNGQLVFDYQLQPGICKEFNAKELMKQMGIDWEKWGE